MSESNVVDTAVCRLDSVLRGQPDDVIDRGSQSAARQIALPVHFVIEKCQKPVNAC